MHIFQPVLPTSGVTTVTRTAPHPVPPVTSIMEHVVRIMLNVPMDVRPDTTNHTVMSVALVTVKMKNVTRMMGSVLVNVPWDIMGRLVMNNAQTTVLEICVSQKHGNVVHGVLQPLLCHPLIQCLHSPLNCSQT